MRHQFTGVGVPAALMLLGPVLAMIGCVQPVAAQRRYPPNWPAANKGCDDAHPMPDRGIGHVMEPVPMGTASANTRAADLILIGHVSVSHPARWSEAWASPVVEYGLSAYRAIKGPARGSPRAWVPSSGISALGGTALDSHGHCVYDDGDPIIAPGDYLIFAEYSPALRGYLATAWYTIGPRGKLEAASGFRAVRLPPTANLSDALQSIEAELEAERRKGASK